MQIIFLGFFLLLSSSLSWAVDLKDTYLVNGCTLINWEGKRERIFPGSFCQFYDDGSFISANFGSIKLIDKDSSIKWEHKGHIHHQVNLSNDLQRILVLSSTHSRKNYRIDRFIILAKDGTTILSENASDLMKQAGQKGYRDSEESHFNSFYEIPEITGKAPPYIKKGNFIANSIGVGVFILSPDLKKVLHFRKIHTAYDHQVHDAQILPNGHMIYFNNSHFYSALKVSFSTIEELDLNNDNIVFEFRANPEASFFSRHCGGVQKIDEDTFLFSHMLTGTYVYSIKQKTIVKNIYQTHMEEFDRFFPAQQVKAVDLRAFLSHWK